MVLAAQPGSPIGRLVLNDVGPYIPEAALRQLGNFIGSGERRFALLDAAELRFRELLAPFGTLCHDE